MLPVLGVNKHITMIAGFMGVDKRHVKKTLRKVETISKTVQRGHVDLLSCKNSVDQRNVHDLQNLRHARSLQIESCNSLVQWPTDMVRSIEIEEREYIKVNTHLKRCKKRKNKHRGLELANADKWLSVSVIYCKPDLKTR